MGIRHQEVSAHWNYFFCIEDDILRLSRWIEFSSDNESVYSIELARLLMTAAAEVDVVAKALCADIDLAAQASSINAYQGVLTNRFPAIHSAEVQIPRFGKTLHPWSAWETPRSPPLWWQGNNRVKHHRAEHFKDANLKNVLNAAAGLFVLLLLNSARQGPSLYPGPKLFAPRTFAYTDGDGIVFNEAIGVPPPKKPRT